MTSTLTVGNRSTAVTRLQQQLSKLGLYKVSADGVYGPITRAAVSSFERAHGLKADGIADPTTRSAISAALKPSTALRQGMTGERVETMQAQLQRLGLYQAPVDGRFGPVTQKAVQAFERAHGWRPDGVAGNRVQQTLAKEVKALPAPSQSWKTVKAPPADYRVVQYRGARVNVRTRVMIERAESFMKQMGLNSKLVVTQGSYNTGVSASAGTHDGGGALDISVRGYSSANADKVVKAMRMAGFAAWRRGVGDSLPPHIHAIAIGDRRATQIAKNQVAEYFRGGDGLVGSRRDIHLTSVGHNIGRPVPNWAR